MLRSGSVRAKRCSVGRAFAAVALAVIGALAEKPARADVAEPGLENLDIRYVVGRGVRGCPSAGAFRADVRRRLDAKAQRPAGSVVVTTEIAPDAAGLRARITMTAAGVEQTPVGVQDLFGGKSECATLSAAAALTVALAIEQSLESLESLEERAREPPRPNADRKSSALRDEPRPAPERPAERPALPRPSGSAPKLHVRTYVAAFAGYGIVPRWSGGSAVGASIRYARWSAGLETVFWLWSTVTAADDPGLAARARLVALRGALCAHLDPLFACGTAALGDYRVAGTGTVISRSDHVLWPALGGRVGLELPVSRGVSILLRADIQVPLVRASLELDARPRWRASPIGLEVGPACQVTLW